MISREPDVMPTLTEVVRERMEARNGRDIMDGRQHVNGIHLDIGRWKDI